MIAAAIIMGVAWRRSKARSPVAPASCTRDSYERCGPSSASSPRTRCPWRFPPKGALSFEEVFGGPPGSHAAGGRRLDFTLDAGTASASPGRRRGQVDAGAARGRRLASIKGVVRLDAANIADWPREQLGRTSATCHGHRAVPGPVARTSRASARSTPSSGRRRAARRRPPDHLERPKGYDRRSAGGHNLSGGQRQRLGLRPRLLRPASADRARRAHLQPRRRGRVASAGHGPAQVAGAHAHGDRAPPAVLGGTTG